MKMNISINGHHFSTGHIIGKGHLGAQIGLNDHFGSGKPKMDIFLSGYDTNNPEEIKCLKWPHSILEKGDRIEIEMMPDSPADEPLEVKSLLKDRKTISATEEQAELILKAAYSCNELLNKMLSILKNELPESEYKKLADSVGAVISEIFSSITGPVYGMHPSMVREKLSN